jgi:hypothetical protein
MLQLQNETPFPAQLALFADVDGVDALHLTVRATFSVTGSEVRVADAQRPVELADIYLGDPGRSSLARAAELHHGKPSTDVVLLGEAWAPGGRPAPEVDVTLAVGPVRKTVRVFGDRAWTPLLERISPPVPFERMPLVYERAFGGIVEIDPDTHEPLLDPRNPVGMGFARAGKRGPPSARRLPNLEDPRCLIADPADAPPPAGFGFIAPFWQPRCGYAGTYDAAWRKTRAPFLPQDFDRRFHNVAPPELVCATYLEGGEPVTVLNASPEGHLRFRIPRCRIEARVHVAGAVETPPLRLATVVVEPGAGLLGLAFQATVRCDKKRLAVERIQLGVRGAA